MRPVLRLAICLLPIALLSAGCTTSNSFLSFAGPEKPVSAPCRVVVTWLPEVHYEPDPTHGGAKTPGIAGRIYLFGEDMTIPVKGEGALVVYLFDRTTGKPETNTPLEGWRIDKDTLKRLEKHDPVGWGYTVFLPWGSYKPEINKVEMRLQFEPAKGGYPLYAQSAPVTLKKDALTMTSTTTTRVTNPQGQEIRQAKANDK